MYETLVFGYCDDDASGYEVLYNRSCAGLVDVDSLHTSVVLVLCDLAPLEPFVVWSGIVHDCSLAVWGAQNHRDLEDSIAAFDAAEDRNFARSTVDADVEEWPDGRPDNLSAGASATIKEINDNRYHYWQ